MMFEIRFYLAIEVNSFIMITGHLVVLLQVQGKKFQIFKVMVPGPGIGMTLGPGDRNQFKGMGFIVMIQCMQ